MKSEKKILIAFVLNLAFSVFEMVGSVFTGSVAVAGDALHDMGDAVSIGAAYFFEKKSKKSPNKTYTFGYGRYSLLGGVITTAILLLGSVSVIAGAISRIFNPTEINYKGMIVFALVGAAVNFIAAYITHGGHSKNQRAVNLHMLEDVIGWVVVLVGAIVMRFTHWWLIDPIMSIGVVLFIFVDAAKNLCEIVAVFLEKAPEGYDADKIREKLCEAEGVRDVHHIHLWSINGENAAATVHIVAQGNMHTIKERVRHTLHEAGICHVTIETEEPDEHCGEMNCCLHQEQCLHSHCHSHHH